MFLLVGRALEDQVSSPHASSNNFLLLIQNRNHLIFFGLVLSPTYLVSCMRVNLKCPFHKDYFCQFILLFSLFLLLFIGLYIQNL